MADPKIPLSDLPPGLAGAYDKVAGVDTATGDARLFPMPQPGTPRSYATRASLPAASGFPEGYTVWVNNDPTPANNGTWAVLGGVWVLAADRVSGLEGRVSGAEDEIEDHAETLSRVGAMRDQVGEDIEVLTDVRGAVVRRMDERGQMYVPGIGGGRSVQAAILDTEAISAIGSGIRPRDLMALVDSEGNVAMRMDERGALYVPGSRMPVQAALGQTLSPTAFPRTEREELHPLIKPMVADLITEGLPFVPPPTLLVPNHYDVPNGFVNAFTVEQGAGIFLETPYATGGLVHPHLIEMRAPFLGYRYLLGETPHKFASPREENPVVYGSNDLRRFDLIPDIPQPLGFPPPGALYNSDIAWVYDPRLGELICVWRSAETNSRSFHYRSTANGVDWTPEVVVTVTTGGNEFLSPSILYDPDANLWRLWTVNGTHLEHRTGPSVYGPWALVSSINFPAVHGIAIWHAEVKWLGSRFALLANQDGANSNLWLGLSDNGTDWSMGEPLIQPQVPNVYKGTFIPEFDGHMMRIHVAWNTYPAPVLGTDAFHLVSSNWADLNEITP